MKIKDKISDLYRKQVEEFLDSQSCPESRGTLIEKEMTEIWKNISTELDIDDVWNNLSSDLDNLFPEDPGSGIVVKSIAAVIIALVTIIPVRKVIPDLNISQPESPVKTGQNVQPSKLAEKMRSGFLNTGEPIKRVISPASYSSPDSGLNEYGTCHAGKSRIKTENENVCPITENEDSSTVIMTIPRIIDSEIDVSPDKVSLEKTNMPPELISIMPERIKILSGNNPDSLETTDNNLIIRFSLPLTDSRRFTAGITALLKNTWLLNHETFDGLKSESLNTTEIMILPDAGITLNYKISKTWQLQADGFFYSNTGQEYHEYIYGHYSRKKITLQYSTMVLSAKYKLDRGDYLEQRPSVNILAGGYLSVLNYAHQKINANFRNIRSQYWKYDIGVRFGSEIELPLSDNMSLAPGIFFSFGIFNIYKGENNIPGYFRRTHNGSTGFLLSYYYHFN